MNQSILTTACSRPGHGRLSTVIALAGVMFLLFFAAPFFTVRQTLMAPQPPTMELADASFKNRDWRDALNAYKRLSTDVSTSPAETARCLSRIEQCLRQLNDQSSIDSMLRSAIQRHSEQPTVLDTAAGILLRTYHYGTVAGGKFVRGYAQGYSGRGGWAGAMINVSEQDRAQAVAWRRRALELLKQKGEEAQNGRAAKEVIGDDVAAMQISLAKALLWHRDGNYSWKLQDQTPLSKPVYNEIDVAAIASTSPPADQSGDSPLIYAIPESWDKAQSDGERLRWCFSEARKSAAQRDVADDVWAGHLSSIFSVATIQQYSWMLRHDGDSDKLEGRMQVHTLTETESIAKLATGVHRFELAADYSHVAIWKSLANSAQDQTIRKRAMQSLSQAYLNRRQYSNAANWIAKEIAVFGDDHRKNRQTLLDSILQPRVKFDASKKQTVGQPISVSVVHRNTQQLAFTATKIDLERLISTWKEYHRLMERGNGKLPGKRESDLEAIVQSRGAQPGQPTRLFQDDTVKLFLTQTRETWQQTVQMREDHWDSRDEIQGPTLSPGVYLVDVVAGDAGRARVLIWVEDMALVQLPTVNGPMLMVSDLADGAPVRGATIEYFGFGNPRKRQRTYTTSNFARRTDASGSNTVQLDQDLQWTTIVRRETGNGTSLALLDARRHWQNQGNARLEQLKAFAVSDRPIYKPGESARIKIWLAKTGFGDIDPGSLGNQKVTVNVIDPKGTASKKYALVSDKDGGVAFDFPISSEATLGQYYLAVAAQQGNRNVGLSSNFRFRVEEYRKPEFEVTVDAPEKPVALGETVNARIKAAYYFGAPVSGAKAIIRVERSAFQDEYYPPMPYDWFYGPGYWWVGRGWQWHPTIDAWRGCMPAPGPYRPQAWSPSELVLEKNVELDENGEAKIEIDTAQAKMLLPDSDHKYKITVEVTDSSRRVQSTTGTVVASRKPFQIYAWSNRGYYTAGDRVAIKFQARQLTDAPVEAEGIFELFQLSFNADGPPGGKVVERSVFRGQAATDAAGNFTYQGVLPRGGQYRAELRLKDVAGRDVQGGHIFTVRGTPRAATNDFRYDALELTPDKKEYAPGDTLKLLVASNQPNVRVAVFIRPKQGVYSAPQWIHLDGKSKVVPIKIQRGDMPNFFIEAISIHAGEVHRVSQQIVVPPAAQMLTTKVSLNKEEYQPGEAATATVEVTDQAGQPGSGSCVLAVYDRSLEALAGDVLPEDIRIAFWKLLRSHYPAGYESRGRKSYSISIRSIAAWQSLGIFGWSTADDAQIGPGRGNGAMFGGLEMMADSVPMAASSSMGGGGMGGGGMGGGGMGGGGMGGGGMGMGGGGGMGMAGGRAMKRSSSMAEGATPPKVRKDFADAAVWIANLELDANGKATHQFRMPENLTSWQVRTWTVDPKVRVGSAKDTATTRKPLLVRLAAPRFLVEKDRAFVTAIVRNDFESEQSVTVNLQINGETQLRRIEAAEQIVTVAAHAEKRVEWEVEALAAGEIALTASAVSELGGDATQTKLPINVYGALKTDAFVGTIRGGQQQSQVQISVPQDRLIQHSRLVVKVSPSLAMAMVDSLPYLIEYPYGCTEQTLNRFLPAVITQQTLRRMEVDLAAIRQHQNNLNTQELNGRPNQHTSPHLNPVFDDAELAKVVEVGVRRLTNMQLPDGGWGWFSGNLERSSVHTTATALRGLMVAKENDVPIVPDVLRRAVQWMQQHAAARLGELKDEESNSQIGNSDALALYTLGVAGQPIPELQSLAFEQRKNLSLYGKVLLALTAHETGAQDQLQVLLKNIEQYLVQDKENETAFLRGEAPRWYWYGNEIETNAMYLKLLSKVSPKSVKASRCVKYLLNNRRHATYWNNTRDTALVVEAMGDYLAATGEGSGPTDVTVLLGEKRLGEIEFTGDNLFTAENTLTFKADAVPSGDQTITIRRTGNASLYYSVYLTNFSQEEHIASSGLELKVQRKYYRLVPEVMQNSIPGNSGIATKVDRRQLKRVPVADGQQLESGTLIEVELLVESKNDYEYVMLRDQKAGGLEATDTTSGYEYSGGTLCYKELRTDHVALFCRSLRRGNYSFRYQLRTETPGTFSAPPASVECMYADEISGTSKNSVFNIQR